MSPVEFDATCPSCGRDVVWTAVPSHGNHRNDPGGQPRYKFHGCRCDWQTPHTRRAA